MTGTFEVAAQLTQASQIVHFLYQLSPQPHHDRFHAPCSTKRHASRLLDTQLVNAYMNQQQIHSPLESHHPQAQLDLPRPGRSRSNSVDNTTQLRLSSMLHPDDKRPTPSRSETIPVSSPKRNRFSAMPPTAATEGIYLSEKASTSTSTLDFALPEIPSLNLSYFDNDSSELVNLTKTLGANLDIKTRPILPPLDIPSARDSIASSSTYKINRASEIIRSSLTPGDFDNFPQPPSPSVSALLDLDSGDVPTDKASVERLRSELKLSNTQLTDMQKKFNRIKDASKLALDELTRAKDEFVKELTLREKHEYTIMQLRQQLTLIHRAQAVDRNEFSATAKEEIERLAQFRVELDKSCTELKECRSALTRDIEDLTSKKQAGLVSLINPTHHLVEQQKAFHVEIKTLRLEKNSLHDETRELTKIRDDVINEMVMLNTKNAELSMMNNDLSRRVTEREREAAAVMAGTSFLQSPSPSLSNELQSPVATQRKSSETTPVVRKVSARDSFNGTQSPKMFKIKKKGPSNMFGKFGGKSNKTEPIPDNGSKGMPYSLANGNMSVQSLSTRDRQGSRDTLSPVQGPHAFQPTAFLRPVKCDACGEKMWGLSELRCQGCGFVTHAKCLSHVPQLCFASTTSSLDLLNMSETETTGKPVSMFGVDLTVQAGREERSVPLLVEKCIAAVEIRGMDYEGIYRKSGGAAQMRGIQQAFEQGLELDLDSDEEFNDICAVTSVLKQYFRELPNPLLTFELYPQFIEAVSMNQGPAKMDRFFELFSQVPTANYETLKMLFHHLYRVQQRHNQNLMTTKNLAMVFGPTLMRDKDPSRDLLDMSYKNAAIEFLIHNAFDFFPLR
ncbi:hypothetical protein DFQ29_003960 [Apophysomyces sp. BC1021]|nr:hypothetical protein DFQ29_003960 [Apophysomyces sp. BC1021]